MLSQSAPTILVYQMAWYYFSAWNHKNRSKIWVAKSRCKKQGYCYSKEKMQPGLFSFWMTMTLFFTPCFLQPIFWTFFSGSQTDPCFQNKNSGFRLTGWRCFFTDTIWIVWPLGQAIIFQKIFKVYYLTFEVGFLTNVFCC